MNPILGPWKAKHALAGGRARAAAPDASTRPVTSRSAALRGGHGGRARGGRQPGHDDAARRARTGSAGRRLRAPDAAARSSATTGARWRRSRSSPRASWARRRPPSGGCDCASSSASAARSGSRPRDARCASGCAACPAATRPRWCRDDHRGARRRRGALPARGRGRERWILAVPHEAGWGLQALWFSFIAVDVFELDGASPWGAGSSAWARRRRGRRRGGWAPAPDGVFGASIRRPAGRVFGRSPEGVEAARPGAVFRVPLRGRSRA